MHRIARLKQNAQCELLKSTLTSIQTQISSPLVQLYGQEQKEDLLYDAKFAKDMVLEWKAFILRAQNQDQAKQDALRSLDNNTVLVIMDWAMKFIQKKYREKQSDTEHYLGVASYVHLFDSCAQDWLAVLSIISHLLKTAKVTKPHITKAYLRSDGAGCYHNNNLIAAVSEIGKRIGTQILRYV